MSSKYLVLDIESTGLHPCEGARITCICAKTSEGNWFRHSGDDEYSLIYDFLTWLGANYKDHFLITANGRGFDVPFITIRAFHHGFAFQDVTALHNMFHVDICQWTKKWMSVNDLAHLLLGKSKYMDGKSAIVLFAEKKFDELPSIASMMSNSKKRYI